MSMSKIWAGFNAWINGEKTLVGPLGMEADPNAKKNAFQRWIDGEKSPVDEGVAAANSLREQFGASIEEKDAETVHKHHEKGFTERLEAWVGDKELPAYRKFYNAMSIILALVVIVCMLWTVTFLPSFGEADNPAHNEVSRKYIEDAMADTGAVNVVAGMILDYRAFDTFGESTVLFIAVGAVIILLAKDRKKKGKELDDALFEPNHDIILAKISEYLIPAALMLGMYIILNGHLSPGGGFSGGTIMGAGLILYYNVYGSEKIQTFFSYRTFNTITVSALGFYAIAKSYSFYTGANHIHSIIPKGTVGEILSSGLILPLNICVGVVVACTMFGFYSLFSREAI